MPKFSANASEDGLFWYLLSWQLGVLSLINNVCGMVLLTIQSDLRLAGRQMIGARWIGRDCLIRQMVERQGRVCVLAMYY